MQLLFKIIMVYNIFVFVVLFFNLTFSDVFLLSDHNSFIRRKRRDCTPPNDPLQICSKSQFSCSLCCKHFKTRQSLNTHQNFVCQFIQAKTQMCQWCKKKFLTKHQVTLHEESCYVRKRKKQHNYMFFFILCLRQFVRRLFIASC